MTNKAFIFLNGEMNYENEFYKNILENEKNIFCADGGLKYAMLLNKIPLEIWGDLDSVDETLIDKSKTLGSKIIKFNPHKDFTDGELVISEISKRNFDKIIILGGLGGRTDHFLTNLNLLFKYDNLYFIDEKEIIFKVEDGSSIKNYKDHTVSFVPMTDFVENLSLDGFVYPLNNFLLKRGDSICNSNILKTDNGKINFSKGKLICILEK